jgi:hypothetical protein
MCRLIVYGSCYIILSCYLMIPFLKKMVDENKKYRSE